MNDGKTLWGLALVVGLVSAALSTIPTDVVRVLLLFPSVVLCGWLIHINSRKLSTTVAGTFICLIGAAVIIMYGHHSDTAKEMTSASRPSVPSLAKDGPKTTAPPNVIPKSEVGTKRTGQHARTVKTPAAPAATTLSPSKDDECPGGVCQSGSGSVSNPTVNNAPQTVNCPNGICQSSGTMNNPTVNNYGPPPAEIHYRKTNGPIERDRPVRSDALRALILSGKIPTPKYYVTEFEVSVVGQSIPKLIIQSNGAEEITVNVYSRSTGTSSSNVYEGPEHRAIGHIDQAFGSYGISVASYFNYAVDLQFGCPGSQCIIAP